MIVVTGGAGFIGSALLARLNELGRSDILVVDELKSSDRWKNLLGKRFRDYLHKDDFLEFALCDELPKEMEAIVHLGACSSTTELDADYLYRNNFLYTKELALYAAERGIRFIYASSAATYGDGSQGFSDASLRELRPLNAYGFSKQLFDLWAEENGLLGNLCGLKFFNVFGPNEYHKADMRSVALRAFEQIEATGEVTLFKSYHPDYADGEQRRDFVYVKDCVEVMVWLLANPSVNGLYNLGTGQSRTWLDLANAVFIALDRAPQVRFVEMPEILQTRYQYFTEAKMEKLRAAGCPVEFRSLEESVRDYVQGHLVKGPEGWYY